MERSFARARVASYVNHSLFYLTKAGELADQFDLFKLSGEILHVEVELAELARDLLELPKQPAAPKELTDVPF
jgi:hypothetical protein